MIYRSEEAFVDWESFPFRKIDDACLARLRGYACDPDRSFGKKVRALLRFGAEQTGTERGVLTQIHPGPGTHRIVETSMPDPRMPVGTTHDLSDTPCRATIARGAPVTIHNASAQGWTAVSSSFGVEGYLGTKVCVGSQLYGTVCFVTRDSRDAPFSEADVALLEGIAHWIGRGLERTESAEYEKWDALWADREFLRRVEQVAGVGGWEIDLDTRELLFTDEIYRIYEVPFDAEIDVEAAFQFYPPEARARLRNALDRCIDEGTPYNLELPIDTGEGNRRWVRARGEALYGNDGTPTAVTGTLQDITEQWEMRERFREQRDLLQSITENVSEGIFRSTPEDGIVYANRAFMEVFGYERLEHLQALDPLELYAVPDRRKELLDLVEETQGGTHEVRCRRRDGSTFPGRFCSTVVRNEAGGIKYIDGVVTDLTEQKRRQRQLRLFKKVVEQVDEGVLITEAEPLEAPGPRIEYVNEGFADITGYAPEEVEGQTPRILQGPKTDPEVLRRIRKRLAAEEHFEGEAINYRKDGTPYVNQWTIDPIRDEDGTITHWASIQRDVTDERLLWKKLLDVQNEERRRIDQEIHDEVAGLLSSIQMTVELARMAPETKAIEDRLGDIEEMVDELSSVARTISRQLHPQTLEEDGLADALAYLERHFREEYGLDVQQDCDVRCGEALSPIVEEMAFRVVQEALLNVVQHAGTDAAQVRARQGEEVLSLSIRDEGVGFDPSIPFEDDTCYDLEGLRDRVDRLGGTLEIDSAPGNGAHVSATLPLSVSFLPERDLPFDPWGQ